MRLGLLAGPENDWRESLEKVQIAEELGVEFVALGEAWGKSIIPWLATIATNTSEIKIGSSILNTYSRTPAAISQEYAMLEELSEGRMILGLGSSGANVVEHFHGVPFEKPLSRIREYVEIFNTLISGEKLNYEGSFFQMSRGFQLHYNRTRNKIPVYIAAITPKSIRQTGEIADGIYPIHWPRGLFEDLRLALKEGAASSDNPNKEFTIAPFTKLTILDGSDTDDEKWLEARELIHHYVNRMGVMDSKQKLELQKQHGLKEIVKNLFLLFLMTWLKNVRSSVQPKRYVYSFKKGLTSVPMYRCCTCHRALLKNFEPG